MLGGRADRFMIPSVKRLVLLFSRKKMSFLFLNNTAAALQHDSSEFFYRHATVAPYRIPGEPQGEKGERKGERESNVRTRTR